MINFLKETESKILAAGLSETNIAFIGSLHDKTGFANWDAFRKEADFYYDKGYGAQEIRGDLVIIFDNGGKLIRREYDGSEWWQYHEPVKVPEQFAPMKWIKSCEEPPYNYGDETE
jgi:hypothetical protein